MQKHLLQMTLKGLGHAMFRNFCTDQLVFELTEISMKVTAKTCRATQQKHRKANRGHVWARLEKIVQSGLHLGKLEKCQPDFLTFISFWLQILFMMLRNHPSPLCGCDLKKKKTTALLT